MKEIKSIEMIQKEIIKYVACDGREFMSKRECERYEFMINEKNLHYVEQCHDVYGYAMFDGCEHMDYHEYIWYRPHSKEDIDVLTAVYGDDCYFNEDDIGQWVCVENCDDSAWKTRLKDGVEYVRRILNKLGYEMEIKNKEN